MEEDKKFSCPICGKELRYIILGGSHKMECRNCGMITGSCSTKEDLYKEMERFEV